MIAEYLASDDVYALIPAIGVLLMSIVGLLLQIREANQLERAKKEDKEVKAPSEQKVPATLL